MSLVTNAMPWTNDEPPSKKRVATMRKTIKAKPFNKENTDSSPDAYMPSEDATLYSIPTSEEVQKSADERSARITQLIHQMSNVSENNDGAKLADFRPPPYAVSTTHEESEDANEKAPQISMKWMPTADEEIEDPANDLQQPIPKIQAHNQMMYGPTYSNAKFGNYNMSYDPTQIVYKAAAAANKRMPSQLAEDSKLMEKINYMIRLLENQAVEKTANITEEFILYTFLGVFMIFVLDSFVRVGKYVR